MLKGEKAIAEPKTLKNLGELIIRLISSRSDSASPSRLTRSILYLLDTKRDDSCFFWEHESRYDLYYRETKKLIEEIRSTAIDWYKSVGSEKEFDKYSLMDRIRDKIYSLTKEGAFNVKDSEYLVTLGRFLLIKWGKFILTSENYIESQKNTKDQKKDQFFISKEKK